MFSFTNNFVDYLRELQELCLGHQAVRTNRHKAGILGSDLRLRQPGSVEQTGDLHQPPSVNINHQASL